MKRGSRPPRRSAPAGRRGISRLLLSSALLLAHPACVERKLLLRSEPSGAVVRMDGRTVGATPVEVDFTWYGTHEVILDKPGHAPVRTFPTVRAPVWQWFPIDLFFETAWPGTLTDRHVLDIPLGPPLPPPDQGAVDALLERAAGMRARAAAGG